MDLFDRVLELSQEGFFCSQIMMLLVLEAEGKTNPDLVRAMGGLNGGLGFSGDICGCLTGGCCLLSYYMNKGEAEELEDPELRQVIAEFLEWFRTKTDGEFGGHTCYAITQNEPMKRIEICPGLIGDTMEKCMDLLTERGVL